MKFTVEVEIDDELIEELAELQRRYSGEQVVERFKKVIERFRECFSWSGGVR